MALTSCASTPAYGEIYLNLCREIYADDDQWIPAFEAEIRTQFDPVLSFYTGPGSRHRHFLATVDRRVVGHATAFVNDALKDRDGTPVGSIGFFEVAPDEAAATDLIGAATDWLISENGLRRIWAPVNFDIWHGYRFVTSGFGQRPFVGEPYGKSYYPELFENIGFRQRQCWTSAVYTARVGVEKLTASYAPHYNDFVAQGYRFVGINFGDREELHTLHGLLAGTLRRFLGYTAISFQEFERHFISRPSLFDPRISVWLCTPKGRRVGVAIAYPDHAARVRAMRGHDGWLGRLRFATHERPKRAVYFLVGVDPEYIRKVRGLGRAMSYFITRAIARTGYEEFVAALISERSPVRPLLHMEEASSRRDYALYELAP
jgi:hypothetical protein